MASMMAATILALLAIAIITALLSRTHVHIIIRKDPDMATIKERLAALEASVADLNHPSTGAASVAEVTALTGRVDAIDAEIGSDPVQATGVADGGGETVAV